MLGSNRFCIAVHRFLPQNWPTKACGKEFGFSAGFWQSLMLIQAEGKSESLSHLGPKERLAPGLLFSNSTLLTLECWKLIKDQDFWYGIIWPGDARLAVKGTKGETGGQEMACEGGREGELLSHAVNSPCLFSMRLLWWLSYNVIPAVAIESKAGWVSHTGYPFFVCLLNSPFISHLTAFVLHRMTKRDLIKAPAPASIKN